MMSEMSAIALLLTGILLALVLIIGLACAFWYLTRRYGPIDRPSSGAHKVHKTPMPLAGGMALAVTMLALSLFFNTAVDSHIFASLAAGMVVFVFGLWDDYRNLSPSVKLVGQVLGALVLIRLGVSIQVFESPEFFFSGTGLVAVSLNLLLTVLWVVGITNAFNFVDSMDGLAVGLGGVAAGVFMLMALDANQPLLALQCALLVGACAGLYFFNSPPAFFFMGDSGSQTLGFFLAAVAIAYRPPDAHQASSWLVPLLVLGLPIFDTSLVVVSRLRRHRPIYQGGKDHTYHRLVKLGLDSNHAVLAMHFVSLLLGCLAILALNLPPVPANVIFGLTLLLGMGGIYYLDLRAFWRTTDLLSENHAGYRSEPQPDP